jgi:hypothetical protein
VFSSVAMTFRLLDGAAEPIFAAAVLALVVAIFWQSTKPKSYERYSTARIDEDPVDKSRDALECSQGPRLRSATPETPAWYLTLRIQVPVNKSLDDLKGDLNSIIEQDREITDIIVHSLACMDRDTAYATATFHTSIPEDKLFERLRQGSEGQSYCYDWKFYGITPIHEDQNRVDVE